MVRTVKHIEGIREVKHQRGRDKGNSQEPSSDSLSHIAFYLLNMITRVYEAKYKQRLLVMVSDAHCVQFRACARGTGMNRDPALKKTTNERETRIHNYHKLRMRRVFREGFLEKVVALPPLKEPQPRASPSKLFYLHSPNVRGESSLGDSLAI